MFPRIALSVYLVLFAATLHASAGNGAVSAPNANMGADYVEGGTVVGTLTANVPIGEQYGLTLGARLTDNGGGESYGGSVGFFARDYKLGHAGVTASFDEIDADHGADARVRGVDVRGALYVDQLDLFASWTRSRTRFDSPSNTSRRNEPGWLGVGFFLAPDIRFSFALGFDDADDDYAAALVMQPDFFSRQASLGVGLVDADNQSSEITVSFRYYFGEARPLIKRYREDFFF